MELTFRTTDQGAVSGIVLGPSGDPVAGALVTAPDGTFVLTDQNGSFSLLLPPGPVQLQVQRDGYNDMPWDLVVVPGEEASIGSRQLTANGGLGPFLLPLATMGAIATVLMVALVVRRRS
jgi:Carboxypeptidase regulatory-like domain